MADDIFPDKIVFAPAKSESHLPETLVFEASKPELSHLPETLVFEPMAPPHQLPEFIDFPSDEELPPEKPKPWEQPVEEDEFPVDSLNDDFPVDDVSYDEDGGYDDYEVDVMPDYD
jgi:hypothetical protein